MNELLIRLIEAMDGNDRIVLSTEHFVLSVERLDRLLAAAVAEPTYRDRGQECNPEEREN